MRLRSFQFWSVISVALLAGGLLVATGASRTSQPAQAAATTDSGDINVSGLVAGPPPAAAPEIDQPTNGATLTRKNIAVSGGCISGLVVKLFRNNIFAGSSVCKNDGTFRLNIDLFIGRNDIVARQYDAANQASPDSGIVKVFYVLPSTPATPGAAPRPQTPGTRPDRSGPTADGSGSGLGTFPGETTPGGSATANFQLIIQYDYTIQGVFVGQPFKLPLAFGGGSPPYALSVDWGDGRTSLLSQEQAQKLTLEHVYGSTGYKTITVRVSGAKGNQAYLQFVISVSGDTKTSDELQLFGNPRLNEIWPYVVLPSLVVGAGIGWLLHGWADRRKQTKMS